MSPIVLGIDTSGTWCSAALVRDSFVAARRLEVGNAHSDHVLDMVDEVLREADIALDACTAVAFGAGPGSFTGLRVACAVAQGLAFGADIPVAPVGTLDAIARSALADPVASSSVSRVLVAQDARMGELYWMLIDVDRGHVRPRQAPALDTPDGMRQRLAESGEGGGLDIGCGNAWISHGEALAGIVDRVVVRAAADAVDIAALGVRMALDGRLVAAADAAPLYVRDRVAETTRERAARKALSPA